MKTFFIPFYKTELFVAIDEEEVPWIPLRHLCHGIGISHSPQERKVKAHPALRNHHKLMNVMDKAGKSQQMFCLRLDAISYFLSTVNPAKTAVNIEELRVYQEHCMNALQAHFACVPKKNSLSGVYSSCLNEIGSYSTKSINKSLEYFNANIETISGSEVVEEIPEIDALMEEKND